MRLLVEILGGKKYIYHRRDLMPKCVIELVRHWYPNLQDKIKSTWVTCGNDIYGLFKKNGSNM